jgi:hypothetical protein
MQLYIGKSHKSESLSSVVDCKIMNLTMIPRLMMTKRITLSWIQLSPNSTGSFNPELPLPNAEEVPRW